MLKIQVFGKIQPEAEPTAVIKCNRLRCARFRVQLLTYRGMKQIRVTVLLETRLLTSALTFHTRFICAWCFHVFAALATILNLENITGRASIDFDWFWWIDQYQNEAENKFCDTFHFSIVEVFSFFLFSLKESQNSIDRSNPDSSSSTEKPLIS